MKTVKQFTQIYILCICFFYTTFSFAQNVLTYLPETNGQVSSIIILGDTAFIAGAFTTVGGYARNNLAAINIKTGVVLNWDPNSFGGTYLLASNNNTVFTGGTFSTIGGKNRTALAAIDAATGNVTDWNPVIIRSGFIYNNPIINTLVYGDNKLFITGVFDTINGHAIVPINQAVLDATTGQLVNWFTIDQDAIIYTALTSNNILFIGGAINTIGGQSRTALASINLSSNTITTWSPNLNDRVNKMILINGKLYLGGLFSIFGAGFKNGLAYVDTATGLPGNWNPLPSGSSVNDMALAGNDMYVIRNNGILENYDINNGTKTDTWFPNNNMMAIASYGDTVIVGGQFTRGGWVNRNYLFAVTKGLSVGINEVSNAQQNIKVYPNPSTNELYITQSAISIQQLAVSMFDVTGKCVLKEAISSQQSAISVEELSQGMYFVRITDANGAVVKTQKVQILPCLPKP